MQYSYLGLQQSLFLCSIFGFRSVLCSVLLFGGGRFGGGRFGGGGDANTAQEMKELIRAITKRDLRLFTFIVLPLNQSFYESRFFYAAIAFITISVTIYAKSPMKDSQVNFL